MPDNSKASVLFNRQSLALLEEEARRKARENRCACIKGLIKGFMDNLGPDRRRPSVEKKAGDIYVQPQDVEELKPVRQWSDLSKLEKGGVEVVVLSSVKEDVPGWTNQDSYVACVPTHVDDAADDDAGPWEDFGAYANVDEAEGADAPAASSSVRHILVGVMDGHGRLGHEVSRCAASRLPGHWLSQACWKKEPGKALEKAVAEVDHDVYKQLSVNIEYNGSTAVIICLDTNTKLIHCANVGDSRAVLGRLDGGRWEAVALTKDITPDLPSEKERIELSGGIVAPARVDGELTGPMRVWEDWSLTKPGLAMARSLGDGCARRIGVIGDAVVSSRKLTSQDRFILLASDGLWDALSNQDAVSIAAKHLDSPETAVAELTRTTRARQEGSLEDDTTIVMLVLPTA